MHRQLYVSIFLFLMCCTPVLAFDPAAKAQLVTGATDLQGADLTSLELGEADPTTFKGVDFSDARFNSAQLKGLTFIECIFTDAVFTGANLITTKFINCDLGGAQIVNTKAVRLQVQGSKAVRTNFSGSDLNRAQFIDSDLNHAYLKSNNLNRTRFEKVDLVGARYTKSHFNLTVFNNVRMFDDKKEFFSNQNIVDEGIQWVR